MLTFLAIVIALLVLLVIMALTQDSEFRVFRYIGDIIGVLLTLLGIALGYSVIVIVLIVSYISVTVISIFRRRPN